MSNITSLSEIKLTEEQLKSIFFENGFEHEGNWLKAPEVEGVDWSDGGKYSSGSIIFEFQGKHYSLEVTRSGSYFSHYEYEFYEQPFEVEKVTEMIEVTSWKSV